MSDVLDVKVKLCKFCARTKPLTEFIKVPRLADGRGNKCKDCHNKQSKANYHKDIVKSRQIGVISAKKHAVSNKNKYLLRKYGITIEQKQAMFDRQSGKCAICPKQLISLEKSHLDHDHSTGKLRDLLCHSCNVSLGLLKEDQQTIENIRLYLAKHNNNFANVSKFAAYIKEREGADVIETREGYASYSIQGSECYIRDIYTLPSYRNQGFAAGIADRIADIARAAGCTYLTGTVCPAANNSTDSLKVLIAYGMTLLRSNESLLILKKDL